MTVDTLCVQGGWQPKKGEPRQVPVYASTTFRVHLQQRLVPHRRHGCLLGGGAWNAHNGASVLGRGDDRGEEVRLAGEQGLPRLRLLVASREGEPVHGAVGGECNVRLASSGSVERIYGVPTPVEADLEREDVSGRIRQVRGRAEGSRPLGKRRSRRFPLVEAA